MGSYSHIVILGYVSREPKLSYLPSQTAVVDFAIATNHVWNDSEGKKREDACFIDCRCFKKAAETINQYVKKGQQLLISGRLQLDQWEAADGTKRSKHRVFVERFTFVGQGEKKKEEPKPVTTDVVGDNGIADCDEIPF